MQIGGVLVGAGMQLLLRPDDYLHGENEVTFVIARIVEARYEWDCDWLVVDGDEQPTPTSPWRACRHQIRVSCLKRCLALIH